ncbi:phage tail assembly chaperone [Novosphingobium sp.]|uniref:phage tail assembly chaperone n=1 Tax=Novosphingobium sp. TaxID=1874826 RepID=UPI0026230A5D|nr:hypothetical protein [Novosphingobium sp.]
MEEIEIGAHTYRLAKLDAMTQFHIIRRLGGVLAAMRDGAEGGDVFTVLMHAIGEMSDADSEYIIAKCLNGCTRRQDGDAGWAAVFRHGQIMFADISMPDMIQLVWATLQSNLSDFFTGLRSGSLPAGN